MALNKVKYAALAVTTALASFGFANSAQAGIVLPPVNNGVTSLTYGDFDVYSLPFLNFLATGETNQLGDFEVQSTPGAIKDLIVVATGANGGPVNTNFAGMDNALSTPNSAQGTETFVSQGNEPGQVAPFAGDNNGTWDSEISALRDFLGGDDLLIYFNLNENNQAGAVLDAAQDILIWAEVTLIDLDGIAPDMTFVLNGVNPDPTFNAFTNFGSFDFGNGSVDNVGQIHGEICIDTVTSQLLALGPCSGQPNSATINQNLGADRAAFAVVNQQLSNIINDIGTAYDILSLDFRIGELSNGYEQLFIAALERERPPVEVPTPGTLGLLGAGLIGLGLMRRRYKSVE